ncbi:MAG: LOG family protein [Elusimicrobiota bacterium]|jgi:hypothetical protein
MTQPSRPNSKKQHPPDPEGFNVWDPDILKRMDELIDLAKPPEVDEDNRDLVRQIMVTALKTENSNLSRGDAKILSRAIRELRYGFRIFKDYRDRRKVTIFGSARTSKTDPDYKQALQFAKLMAKNGFMTITGAGPGIMQAGNEGAGKNNSFGINIRLPYEQSANEFINKDPRFIDCRFFFTRKLMFVKETSAVAFFPGGFGTHDEAMESLTLVQTGKSDPMPIVFVDAPGGNYWRDWQRYIEGQLLKRKKISPEDMSLYKITDNVDEAVAEILHFYRNYHSLRFVNDQLVIRTLKPTPSALLKELNAEFKSICAEGTILATPPFPEERDHLQLPRIAFAFNRLNFGRLRQLINRLNDASN